MNIDIKILWEIFGYMGTALVITSMLMTSVVKLRVLNVCGSCIGLIYGVVTNTWPNVLLNGCLIAINVYQLIRMRVQKFKYSHVQTGASDKNLAYFLFLYSDDIIKYYPDYTFHMEDNDEAHLVYRDSEIVGILVGRRTGDTMQIHIDYVTPKYRDLSISKFLYSRLKSRGVNTLIASNNMELLIKMGFSEKDGVMTKAL